MGLQVQIQFGGHFILLILFVLCMIVCSTLGLCHYLLTIQIIAGIDWQVCHCMELESFGTPALMPQLHEFQDFRKRDLTLSRK